MSHVGEFLDQYRERKGLKQRALAEQLNISPSHLSHILNGKIPSLAENRQMELKTLRSILSALDGGEIPHFLHCYLQDITDPSFHQYIVEDGTSQLQQDPPHNRSSSVDKLIERLKMAPSPNRTAKVLMQLLDRANGRPDYISAIEKILAATE